MPATAAPPTPIVEPTAEQARAIVERAVARAELLSLLRSWSVSADVIDRAERRLATANARIEKVFPIRKAWYPHAGRVWGWHDFDGSGLTFGSKPAWSRWSREG